MTLNKEGTQQMFVYLWQLQGSLHFASMKHSNNEQICP